MFQLTRSRSRESKSPQKSEPARRNQAFLEPESVNYDVAGPLFTDVPNGKAVIFGLPKCGNAWLQSMLARYFDVEPVIALEDVDKAGVLSTHNPFDDHMWARPDIANAVCLIRDMRDLVASYYQYGRTSQFREAMRRFFYEDIDSFYYEWFLSRCVPAHQMFTFAADFASRGVPVVRYERLASDTEGELTRLLRRWGVAVDSTRVQQVVEDHRLDKLKESGLDLGYRVETTHFRKGGWGNFLDEVPLHITRDITERFGDYLSRWGYPTELSEEAIACYRAELANLCNEPKDDV